MNILLISPGVSKKYNDNYHAYSHMCNMGDSVLAITQRENINKGGRMEVSPPFEVDGNFQIHRIFKTLEQQKSPLRNAVIYHEIKEMISTFKPDVIFCEELSNMMLASKIKKEFNIPIVLRVEFIFNKKYPFRTMGRILKYFKNRITGNYLSILLGKFIWGLACKRSDAIITCYFDDLAKIDSMNGKHLYYVPWPTSRHEILFDSNKIKKRAIFIGSFDHHKNLKELLHTLPMIFQHTPLDEFLIVGAGDDEDVINKLKYLYPDKIRHIKSLSRNECLELIRDSYFSYSPAIRGGWGFVGDSWAMKTPIIVTHNHYNFHDGIDSIVTTPNQIVDRINELYFDKKFYNDILKGGYDRYLKNHTANSVGERFHNICMSVIKK